VLAESGGGLSRGCLVAAIAAIGMKAQLREIVDVGLTFSSGSLRNWTARTVPKHLAIDTAAK
jgi:uncharacterized membrane protein YadS